MKAQEFSNRNTGRDTIVLSKPRSLLSFKPVINGNMTELRGKNIKLPPIVFNSLFQFITIDEVKTFGIRFKSCFFGSAGGDAIPNIVERPNYKRLEFDSCVLQSLGLTKQGNETAIFNCLIGGLIVDSCNDYSLRMMGNSLKSGIFISNSRKLKLAFQNIETDKLSKADIRIVNSEIEKFEFTPCDISETKLLFFKDTINGFFGNYWNIDDTTMQWKKPNTNIRDTFIFDQCYINTDFWIYPSLNDVVFVFRGCIFGPKAEMLHLTATQIHFLNCRFPDDPTPFSTSEFFPTWVSFHGTSIDNLRMNFTPLMKVHIDSASSKDMIESDFRKLLSKFRNEGKKESYRLVDLEYYRYSESKFGFFLNEFFWGHGYEKRLVFRWTAILLVLFWTFNYKYWKQMQQAYPIISRNEDSYYYRKWKKLKFLGLTGLYTIYIFFSIRVSLEKLSFQKLRFAAAFLIQYLLGLISLFFILKYVLEI